MSIQCPKCGTEGLNNAVFCPHCGRSQRGELFRFLGLLAAVGAMVVGFLVLLVTLVPLLDRNQVLDRGWLASGCVLVLAPLYFLGGRRCKHPQGQEHGYCPDCGAAREAKANPFRLSCLLFGTAGLAVALIVLPLLYMLGMFHSN